MGISPAGGTARSAVPGGPSPVGGHPRIVFDAAIFNRIGADPAGRPGAGADRQRGSPWPAGESRQRTARGATDAGSPRRSEASSGEMRPFKSFPVDIQEVRENYLMKRTFRIIGVLFSVVVVSAG